MLNQEALDIIGSSDELPDLGNVFPAAIRPYILRGARRDLDDLGWIIANVGGNAIFSDNLNLVPLPSGGYGESDLSWLISWILASKEDFRKWFLPSTSDDLIKVGKFVEEWYDPEKYNSVYIITPSREYDPLEKMLGYIKLQFSLTDQKNVSTWLTYALLRTDQWGTGLMTRALGMLLKTLPCIFADEERKKYGYVLKDVKTSVSDVNLASIKVLARNGFVIDSSRPIAPAPINAGGFSIPMMRTLSY